MAAAQRDLAEAMEALDAIETRVYAQRPDLKVAEDGFAALRKESAENGELSNRVGRSLTGVRGDGGERDHYLAMVESWSQLTQLKFVEDERDWRMFQSTVDQIEPYRQRLVADMLRGNPKLTKAELADRDGFWRAYKAMAERAIPMYEANLKQNEKRSGFPQFVLDCAKAVGVNDGRSILYGMYCAANTPKELKDARERVRKLAAKTPATRPAERDRVR